MSEASWERKWRIIAGGGIIILEKDDGSKEQGLAENITFLSVVIHDTERKIENQANYENLAYFFTCQFSGLMG